MRFQLQTNNPRDFILVRQRYTSNKSIMVTNVDGEEIKPSVVKPDDEYEFKQYDECGTNF